MLDRNHDPFSHHTTPGPLTRSLSEAVAERPKRRRKRPEPDASTVALDQLDAFLAREGDQ